MHRSLIVKERFGCIWKSCVEKKSPNIVLNTKCLRQAHTYIQIKSRVLSLFIKIWHWLKVGIISIDYWSAYKSVFENEENYQFGSKSDYSLKLPTVYTEPGQPAHPSSLTTSSLYILFAHQIQNLIRIFLGGKKFSRLRRYI